MRVGKPKQWVQWAMALSLGGGAIASLSGRANALELMPGVAPQQQGDILRHHRPSAENSELKPATTVAEWMAQIEAARVQITNVRLEMTATGLQVTLETAAGALTVPTLQTVENRLVAEIENAQILEAFVQADPIPGIAQVKVTNLAGERVQVEIVGTDAPPVAEVTATETGLVWAVTPGSATAATEEEEIEITVTADRVPNITVGTRTDTPLRDIPASIQVIPEQVLKDRQAKSITEGLENTPGVTSIASAADRRAFFTFRGFENFTGFLINGVPDPQISTNGSFVNVERLEVLKGPAAALFGEVGTLGGTVNLVTRQPLSNPFYEISASGGSFNDYQGRFDLSGPLNDSKTVLYRLIGSYRNFETFLNFFEGDEFFIAPSLALKFGSNTDITFESDVNILNRQDGDVAQPVLGTVLENPNGEVSPSFNPQGPGNRGQIINARAGYRLEHQFNENWKLRNTFRFTRYDDEDGTVFLFNDSLAADNRTLNRNFFVIGGYLNTYHLDTNLLGKFNTGSVEHQLLVGFDLTRDDINSIFEFGAAQPVDIFNPVFDQSVNVTGQPTTDSFTRRDTLGLYLQDQVTITENLKLLLGGRVDFFREKSNDLLTNIETSQSDTAFSPRVGIVYQPIQPLSFYASYARSFVPTIGLAADGDTFRPERGTQYEIGLKAEITDQLSASLALYDLTRSNVTTPDPGNPGFSVQTGKQRSRGIEFDIGGEVLPGWNIIGGYAYTDARITEDNDPTIVGNRRFSAPEHTFNLWTTYKIQQGDLQGLGFGLGFFFTGERFTDNANTVELPSFFRTDAAIFYERNRFRAALNFRNIFDVENFTSNAGSSSFVNRGAPFTVQGTISWQF